MIIIIWDTFDPQMHSGPVCNDCLVGVLRQHRGNKMSLFFFYEFGEQDGFTGLERGDTYNMHLVSHK